MNQLEKRELIAALAMQALIAKYKFSDLGYPNLNVFRQELANAAVANADALLAALEKKEDGDGK